MKITILILSLILSTTNTFSQGETVVAAKIEAIIVVATNSNFALGNSSKTNSTSSLLTISSNQDLAIMYQQATDDTRSEYLGALTAEDLISKIPSGTVFRLDANYTAKLKYTGVSLHNEVENYLITVTIE